MKIAVLGTRGIPQIQGGVEAHCENLYPRLVKRGCEVTVFTRKPYITHTSNTFNGVKLIPLSCPKNKFLEAFVHTFKGTICAKKIKPDLIHVHAVGPSLCVPLMRLMGFKVVMTHHGPDYERQKWARLAKMVLRIGEYSGCMLSNEIIAISDQIAKTVQEKYGRSATFIPNGVEIPIIIESNEALRNYGLERQRYILSVGRFVPEKGFHDLVEAFIEAALPDWKLVIVGAADHEDRYSLELRRMTRGNKDIILTGSLTGKPLRELYSHAGLFVLSSYYEGMPISLLEAMSYGLSCIASDIPANKNTGLPGHRLFKARDIGMLTDKIRAFVDKPIDEEERKRQTRFIAEHYDWDNIADKTFALYEKVIPRKR